MIKLLSIKKIVFMTLIFIAFVLILRLDASPSYILNPNAMLYFSKIKYKIGTCLVSNDYWAINPKKVVGSSLKNREIVYLLKDLDRYEHSSYYLAKNVERFSNVVKCR